MIDPRWRRLRPPSARTLGGGSPLNVLRGRDAGKGQARRGPARARRPRSVRGGGHAGLAAAMALASAGYAWCGGVPSALAGADFGARPRFPVRRMGGVGGAPAVPAPEGVGAGADADTVPGIPSVVGHDSRRRAGGVVLRFPRVRSPGVPTRGRRQGVRSSFDGSVGGEQKRSRLRTGPRIAPKIERIREDLDSSRTESARCCAWRMDPSGLSGGSW